MKKLLFTLLLVMLVFFTTSCIEKREYTNTVIIDTNKGTITHIESKPNSTYTNTIAIKPNTVYTRTTSITFGLNSKDKDK